MRRPLLHLAAALALAALLAPGRPAAAPPAGIAYTETVRTFIEVPPPALGDPEPPVPSPAARKRGLGQLLPSHAEGDEPEIAVAGHFGLDMHARQVPRTRRHAFYDGWERIDDPAAGTAVLRECDRNRIVTLDLGRRTYRITAPADEPLPEEPAAGRAADVAAQIASVALPPATADGIPVTGYRQTTALTAAEAGNCRSGVVTETAYYTKIPRPVRSCPIRPATEDVPPGAVALVAASGCRPVLTVSRSGPVEPADALAAYRSVVFRPAPAPGAPGLLGWLVERSDFTPLGPADAAQFEIPPGFTESRP